MADIPGAGDAAKAADKAKQAADEAKKASQKATQAVDKAAKALDDAKKAADKAKAKARQAMDLAKQAYDLAKDPAMRDKAFAAAQQRAAELQQKADKLVGNAASAFRDAADGANQVYSALKNVGGFEMIPEIIRQQIPAVPNLVPQGIASKLGQAVEEMQSLPAAASSAAARALNAVKMPAMPAPPSSPAVLPCAGSMPTPPAIKQAAADQIAQALGDHAAAAFEPLKQQVAALKPIAQNMLAAGMPEDQVAEIVNWRRRELTSMIPEPIQSYVRAVNQKKYGDPLGRSHQAAKQLLQSSREIIDSACQPPDKLGKLIEGARKFVNDMPTEDIARVADQVRKLKP
jgi:phage gpG-like protein